MTYECSRVVYPLRPRLDVTPLSLAFAVTSQVHRERGHPVATHSVCEALITAAVLAQTMHDGKRDLGAGDGP